jgi:hypothetical protein
MDLNLVSHTEGRKHADRFREKGAEENIWAPKSESEMILETTDDHYPSPNIILR